MKSNLYAVAGCAAILSITAAGAWAQKAPAAAPATASAQGPALPGVCVMSVEGAIATSTVGKYVDGRMKQIVAQVQAELNGEKTGIDNEAKTLQSQRATLDQKTFETRANALNTKAAAFQRKAELRDREVQATQQKAVSRIGSELDPLVRQVYAQRRCGLLLSRDAVVIANPSMDITPAVVTALNGKITQFAFDREHLDQAAATTPAKR